MTPSLNNQAVIATAGSRKTEFVIDHALAHPSERVLITTYTNENLAQISRRIHVKAGCIPPNITIMSWLSFVLNQCARPYQVSILGKAGLIRSLNFHGSRNRFTPRTNPNSFYLDRDFDIYRDGLADFACQVDGQSNGLVITRLATIYDRILVDEVQDLVGYDLDLLDLLFKSTIKMVVVGDPRQHTYGTNNSPKNKRYRGSGLVKWFEERATTCHLEERHDNFRCNQAICDFADALYPDMDATTSQNSETTGHDGIFKITPSEVDAYVKQYNPVILRDSRRTNVLGHKAINIGVAKGSTYDRVLIFPTEPMKTYLKNRNPSAMTSVTRLYIAVTRARFSATFVV